MNGNGTWCAKEKINNNQNSIVQKRDAYDEIINKYLQKIDDQRSKLLVLGEEAIESTRYSRSHTKMKIMSLL